MASPSIWVKREIQGDAARKIKEGNAREAVEILLTNDLSFEENGLNTDNKVDAGALLQTGLSLLNQKPHAALGVEIGANTKEIRSNYKKLAIKYHPDKNPKTTALFQAINTACAKLSDPAQRKIEEQTASTSTKSAPSSYTAPQSKPQPKPAPAPSKTDFTGPGPDTARRAAEEKKRGEEDARAREAARRSEEEARRRYEEEMRRRNDEELRRRKDDIIKEGQRAYMEEQLRAQKEAQVRLERRAAEIAAAAKRAMNANNVPAADAPGLKSFRGVKQPEPRTSHSSAPNPSFAADPSRGKPPSAESHHHHHSSSQQPSGGGRTFTVDSSGNVRPTGGSSREGPSRAPPQPDVAPKVPAGLTCSAFTDSMVDLSWNPVVGLIELNWRNCALNGDAWRSANKLISGTKCRKKNLLPGAVYEFRIRCVAEKPGGMLGLRSPWSACITVALKSPSAAKEEPVSTAYSYSGSDKIKPEVFIRPAHIRKNSYTDIPPASTSAGNAQSKSESNSNNINRKPSAEEKPAAKVNVPSNLRPGSINTARRDSACEVDEEEGIKVAPASTRSRQAWMDGKSSPTASEVDSASESELEDDEEAFTTRHVVWYDVTPPAGILEYEHPVRREPFSGSKLCGYLDKGVPVQAEADCGDWLKVKCHRVAVNKIATEKTKKKSAAEKEVWGWCLRVSDGHDYLSRCHATIPEDDEDDEDADPNNINGFGLDENYEGVWYEMEDEDGHTYYYNDYTGESSWQPPEWIEEMDPESGASYYMHLNKEDAMPLHSTWTRPDVFAKLIRIRPGSGV